MVENVCYRCLGRYLELSRRTWKIMTRYLGQQVHDTEIEMSSTSFLLLFPQDTSLAA